MNKVEELAKLFGGKSRLAAICERTPPVVSKWVKRGHVDPSCNIRIKRAAYEIANGMEVSDDERAAFVAKVASYLEEPRCPHCGSLISEGSLA